MSLICIIILGDEKWSSLIIFLLKISYLADDSFIYSNIIAIKFMFIYYCRISSKLHLLSLNTPNIWKF